MDQIDIPYIRFIPVIISRSDDGDRDPGHDSADKRI